MADALVLIEHDWEDREVRAVFAAEYGGEERALGYIQSIVTTPRTEWEIDRDPDGMFVRVAGGVRRSGRSFSIEPFTLL